MIGAYICFGIAIAVTIAALIYRPKRSKPRKLSYDEMIADRRKIIGKQPQSKRGNTKTYQRSEHIRDGNTQATKNTILIASFGTLTRLVSGQKDVARRLIEGNLKKYPDKSPDWACEKAISDIERDRRI